LNHEIITDGVTVWVNTEANCIARFGVMGIDIHRDLREQENAGECLYCTHGPTTAPDWNLFVAKMLELHKIIVPELYKPKRMSA